MLVLIDIESCKINVYKMPNYNKKIEIKFDILCDNLQISLINKIIYILYQSF